MLIASSRKYKLGYASAECGIVLISYIQETQLAMLDQSSRGINDRERHIQIFFKGIYRRRR